MQNTSSSALNGCRFLSLLQEWEINAIPEGAFELPPAAKTKTA
jgi:hypothetical protein